MAYKNLRFFDSESNDINLQYNSEKNIWEGVCYLPKVSVGLYETLTIYILEEVNGKLGNTKYITPISEKIGETSFKFNFFSGYEFSDDIFMYSAVDNNGLLEIKKDEFQIFNLLDSSNSNSVDPLSEIKIIETTLPFEPIKCNVALMSMVDNYHTRLLDITEINNGVETLIATIRIYGETEEEDERLGVLLSNIGMTLTPSEFLILKDSNINEMAPDWILMNQKRKELLLEASKIKPFIGTYKAILNAIDFFGYDKLTLKEYWLYVNEQSENFGKLKAVPVPGQDVTGFLANKNLEHVLPSSNLKKTSRFSLVYRLNNVDGGTDEWDIPTVKESVDYSPDEVLIKLYGLKNKLQKDFLPLHAKIVDITGEGDYFSQFNLNVWNNQHYIKQQEGGVDVEFSKTPEIRQLYIEDLRKVDYRLTGFNQDFNLLSSTDRREISESINNFYDGYYNDNMSTYNTLEGIPIGCPIVLKSESFISSWDSAEFTYMDASDTGDHMLTWNKWWNQGVYEMEWNIKGPNNYQKTYRGIIGYWDADDNFNPEYQEFPVVLPYEGSYTVELALYDLYNVRSISRKPDYIVVKNKNVEIYGIYQKMVSELNWNTYKYKWNVAGGDWDWSRENTTDIDSIIATYYLTLDRANYIHDGESGMEFSTVRRYKDNSSITGFSETPGPYQWKELRDHTWEDGITVNWEMTRIGADINSSFKIDVAGKENGHKLFIKQVDTITNIEVIDEYEIVSTYPVDAFDIIAWNNIAVELSNLNPESHPLFSKFNYNPIVIDNEGDGILDQCNSILIVAKLPSRTYDYSEVGFSNVLGGLIVTDSEVHFESYNPNFNNLYVIDTHVDINMLNHVTFSYDNTKMPGIVSHTWTLKNNSQKVDDIYYNNQWLTYLFKHKGDYSLELELTDSNGNKNKINKNILKII